MESFFEKYINREIDPTEQNINKIHSFKNTKG